MAVTAASIPYPRRADLVIKPIGDAGEHVVKDVVSGSYFQLPAHESFLLLQLDGKRSIGEICSAFEGRFGDSLAPDDVEQFLQLANAQKLLQPSRQSSSPGADTNRSPVPSKAAPSNPLTPLRLAKKVLFFRRNFFDPDRLFTWLEPKIAFAWTKAFFYGSLAVIVFAALVQWSNWSEYAEYLPEAVTWETIALAWLVLCIVTTGHEFAHGLTCKHFGGEVHELGFMLMFFMPCFYCNVSDSWIIPEKGKRLWITAAGSYFDLILWSMATLVWRVTLPASMPYHFSWIVMSICGARVFVNCNPLVKLDGYYFLSDLLGIPNLRQRSLDRLSSWVRRVLWGAPKPEPMPRSTLLFWFGTTSWLFSVFYVTIMLAGMHQLFLKSLGIPGLLFVLGLAWLVLPAFLRDFFLGEVKKMFFQRWKRTAIWIVSLAAVVSGVFLIHVDDWVSGSFKTRATIRVEIRAPVNGFLKQVHFDEGQQISGEALLGLLDIPDLDSKLSQKSAEQREIEAKLRSLESGARPQELEEQRQRVERAKTWRDRAKSDLIRKTNGFNEELIRLDEQIAQTRAQLEFQQGLVERSKRLVEKNSLPYEQYRDAQKQLFLSQAQLQQAEAQKRERQAVGILEFEGELAKREKELADTAAILRLLEAGSRPEEVDAERAKLGRVLEEKQFLEKQKVRLKLVAPISGIVVTAHLKEKVGQYFKEGDLICEIEQPNSMEIEIPLEEQEMEKITLYSRVDLKPRSRPFQTVLAKVIRIAPQATVGKVQSTVTVCCKPDDEASELISNMTGYARIYSNRVSLAEYAMHRVWRYFRTEIWW